MLFLRVFVINADVYKFEIFDKYVTLGTKLCFSRKKPLKFEEEIIDF